LDTTAESRREPRFMVNDPVRVTVLGLTDHPWLDARIFNLSRSGLLLLTPFQVPRGCAVKVELHGAVVSGKVRYSKKTSDGFSTGVAIDAVAFQEAEQAPEPVVARSPESLWGALKRLYTAVKNQR
jgi:PilZ domain